MKRGSEATSIEPWEADVVSGEPCGSLPVSGITLSAHYCHHHMAWSAHVQTFRETTGGSPEVLHAESMRFGPFDEEYEVRAWMLRALLALEDVSP